MLAATTFPLLIGIIVQSVLAYYVYSDAHSRGHSRDKWALLTLIFGILAVVVYLLTRNDSEVPESERMPKKTGKRLKKIGLYLILPYIFLELGLRFFVVIFGSVQAIPLIIKILMFIVPFMIIPIYKKLWPKYMG